MALFLLFLALLSSCPNGQTSKPGPALKPAASGGELRLPLSIDAQDAAIKELDFSDYRLFALARASSRPWLNCSEDGNISLGIFSTWTANESGDTWTFGLAGQETASADYELFDRSFRALLRGQDGPMRGQISDLIVGAREYALGKAETISGISLSKGSAVVHLSRAHRYFPAWLSQPGLMPRPQKVEDGSYACQGPFRISAISGNTIELLPNDNFSGSKAQLDKLTFICEPDFAKQVELFKAGALDTANVGMKAADAVRGDSALAPALVEHNTAQQLLCQFDQHQFPWGDQKFQPKTGLRQSVNWGMDRATISDILNGQLTPYPHFFPKEMQDFNDPALVSVPLYGIAVQTEDARAAQKRADHEQGGKLIPGMDLAFLKGNDLDDLDIEILKYWDEISIKMRPFPVTTDELRQRIDAGTHEIVLSRVCPAYPDPDALIFPLLSSSLYGLGGNFSCLKSAEYDQAIAETEAAQDPMLRRKLIQQLERKLEEDSTFVFLGYFSPTLLLSPKLAGYELGPYDFDASLPAQDFSRIGIAGGVS